MKQSKGITLMHTRLHAKTIVYALGIFLLLLGAAHAAAPGDYHLAPDDQISITVFGEPDLSLKKVTIATNGAVSLPLIGQVNLKGLTIPEAEALISRRLADGYLKHPNVTVSIAEYRQFYVNGEVKKPGGYAYREGLSVQKAIALAGGFSERASEDKITLLHENSDQPAHKVGLTDTVRPGDIITVDESFF